MTDKLGSEAISNPAAQGDIKTLMAVIQNPEADITAREEAASALALIKKGFKLDYIMQFVRKRIIYYEKEYKLRCLLIIVLGETGDFKVTETLVGLLLDKNEEFRIRYTAAHALGRIGDHSAIDSLVSVLEDPKDRDIKAAVASALIALDETRTALPLLRYLKNQADFMEKYRLMNPDSGYKAED
jgi:HEAT repeat protein